MTKHVATTSSTRRIAPDPRLDALLRRALWLGTALVLLLPAARGHSAWLGYLPLWLLGMPLSALWALHGFRMVPLQRAESARGARRRRRRGVQARRQARPLQRRRTQAA
jgi:hypothetical protein